MGLDVAKVPHRAGGVLAAMEVPREMKCRSVSCRHQTPFDVPIASPISINSLKCQGGQSRNTLPFTL